jgi:hypothetical protein
MKTDRVKVDGATVTVTAANEATARDLGAAIDRERVRLEGLAEEKLDAAFDKLGKIVRVVGRPTFGLLGWVGAAIAFALDFSSFDRLWPGLSPLFGLLGVVVVVAIKVSTSRFAEASAAGDSEKTKIYGVLVAVGLFVVVSIGAAFQLATSNDQASGVSDIAARLDRADRDIDEAQYALNGMPHSSSDPALLTRDILRARAQPALNRENRDAGMTVGKAVAAGDTVGKEPLAYCVSSRENGFYVERYCKTLLDLDQKLRDRLAYDAAAKALAKMKADRLALADSRPKQASSAAMAAAVAGDRGGRIDLIGALFAALMLLSVHGVMIVCTYVSKAHPKGVEG